MGVKISLPSFLIFTIRLKFHVVSGNFWQLFWSPRAFSPDAEHLHWASHLRGPAPFSPGSFSLGMTFLPQFPLLQGLQCFKTLKFTLKFYKHLVWHRCCSFLVRTYSPRGLPWATLNLRMQGCGEQGCLSVVAPLPYPHPPKGHFPWRDCKGAFPAKAPLERNYSEK